MKSADTDQTVTIPEKVAKFRYKDIPGIIIFVFTAGAVGGGYMDMKKDFDALQTKVDLEFKDVRNKIDTKIDGVNQNVFELAMEINKRKETNGK